MNGIRHRGFTLVELLITVVIIGILAAIAYPSYNRYVTQARRSDAQAAIQQIANRLEKYFTYCNTYTIETGGTWPASCPPEPAGTPGLGLANDLSPDRHYQITIAAGATGGACSGAGANINCGYIVTANPNGAGVTGRQQNDGRFRMDSRGIKQWDRDNSGTWDANENTWK